MANKQLHILIAIESFFDGGAEIFAIRLANELALTQNVFFTEVYPYRSKEKRQLALLDQNRIQLFRPGKNFIGDWLHRNGDPTNARGLERRVFKTWQHFGERRMLSFIKKNKVNIINSHSWDSDVYFAQLKRQVEFALVSSFHGHYEFLAGLRTGYNADTKTALDHIDMVIYTSPRHEQTLDKNGYPVDKRRKIFYGVSMPLTSERTIYAKGDTLKLVMAARGIREKGWEEAIEAFLLLLNKYPGALKLTLAGEGAFLDELKVKYKNPSIVFLGYRENVREIVDNGHIGLLPTFYIAESLPNTVIEYLFSGKPVITTDIGAIREMISYDGQLAGSCLKTQGGKPGINFLADAMEKYINEPGLVETHSALALKAAEKFTMQNCIENYLNAYRIPAVTKIEHDL